MSEVTAVIVTTSVIEQLKETETYPAIEFINRSGAGIRELR